MNALIPVENKEIPYHLTKRQFLQNIGIILNFLHKIK